MQWLTGTVQQPHATTSHRNKRVSHTADSNLRRLSGRSIEPQPHTTTRCYTNLTTSNANRIAPPPPPPPLPPLLLALERRIKSQNKCSSTHTKLHRIIPSAYTHTARAQRTAAAGGCKTAVLRRLSPRHQRRPFGTRRCSGRCWHPWCRAPPWPTPWAWAPCAQ